REVRGLPRREALSRRIPQMPRFGPQGRQDTGEDFPDLIGDQVTQSAVRDEHGPRGGLLAEVRSFNLGVMERAGDQVLVRADQAKIALPPGPVSGLGYFSSDERAGFLQGVPFAAAAANPRPRVLLGADIAGPLNSSIYQDTLGEVFGDHP